MPAMKPLTIITLALLLAACQTQMTRVDADVGAAQPAPYKEGYAAGCDSGNVAAGHPYYHFNKEVTRYAADPLYKSGWDDGFAICKGKYEAVQRMMQ